VISTEVIERILFATLEMDVTERHFCGKNAIEAHRLPISRVFGVEAGSKTKSSRRRASDSGNSASKSINLSFISE
jgi:hypothetical protein